MMHQGINVTYKQYRNKTRRIERMNYIWQFVGFGVVFFNYSKKPSEIKGINNDQS